MIEDRRNNGVGLESGIGTFLCVTPKNTDLSGIFDSCFKRLPSLFAVIQTY